MSIATKRQLTAEDSVRLAPEGRWELVRGEVVTYMPVQPEHGAIVSELGFRIREFLGSSQAALVGPEIGFIVARNPDTIRAPDLSLTWMEDAKKRRKDAWIEGGPNLAIEVLSEDETIAILREKVDEYLRSGTELVWVMDAKDQSVYSYRRGTDPIVLHAGDVLTGDPVLPGFRFVVGDL